MIRTIPTFLTAALLISPALAENHTTGDAAAGEIAFKQCATCHVVVDDDGNQLAGKNAKTGPNLYGIIGRQAGTVEGFRYSKSIVAAGEEGLVWDQENIAIYSQDPKAFLQEVLDDKSARSKMSFKVRKEKDAVDLAAFLASLGPAAEVEEAAGSATN